MSAPVAIGPWPEGINNSVPGAKVPMSALSDAVNVDIDKTGTVFRRDAWTEVDNTPAHSLFEHAGHVFGVVGGVLGVLSDEGFAPIAAVTGRLAWAVLNAQAVFASYDGVFVIDNGEARSLPAEIRDDEAELMLAPMPGGQWVSYWNGRLVVARGNSIFFSEPVRYGLYDRLRSFIQFEQRVRWVAPLESGLYVGLDDSVRWLAGARPDELQQRVVGGKSWRGAAAVITTEHMNQEIAAERVAVWMTPSGFAIGRPEGAVMLPQSTRLQNIPTGVGRLAVAGDRITVLSHQ